MKHAEAGDLTCVSTTICMHKGDCHDLPQQRCSHVVTTLLGLNWLLGTPITVPALACTDVLTEAHYAGAVLTLHHCQTAEQWRLPFLWMHAALATVQLCRGDLGMAVSVLRAWVLARMQSEFEKALTHVHFRAEGDVEFRALLCAPKPSPHPSYTNSRNTREPCSLSNCGRMLPCQSWAWGAHITNHWKLASLGAPNMYPAACGDTWVGMSRHLAGPGTLEK